MCKISSFSYKQLSCAIKVKNTQLTLKNTNKHKVRNIGLHKKQGEKIESCITYDAVAHWMMDIYLTLYMFFITHNKSG